MSTEQKECWSFDNENFIYESLDDLLSSWRDEIEPGHIVWRATAAHPKPSDLVDADWAIEGISCRAHDIGGEYAEEYPEVTPEHRVKLQSLLEQWLSECPAPRFYNVKDVQEYTITKEDLE